MAELAENLAKIQQDLVAAAGKAAPMLIGASKTQPVAVLERAIAAGLKNFGENKIQEAQEKWPTLKTAHPEMTLHCIGPIQSNKAEDALRLFDVIHTIDREKLVDAVVKAAQKGIDISAKRFLVQVNTGEEPQKAGVLPEGLPELLAYCEKVGLPIHGLMCIPPADTPAAPHFALLHKLAKRHGLAELSMGMSSDYQEAARLGATMVRVGTSLFGARY